MSVSVIGMLSRVVRLAVYAANRINAMNQYEIYIIRPGIVRISLSPVKKKLEKLCHMLSFIPFAYDRGNSPSFPRSKIHMMCDIINPVINIDAHSIGSNGSNRSQRVVRSDFRTRSYSPVSNVE
jgi:hypothetical protein